MDGALKENKKVFVHCAQGKDRSATVVIAYIMSRYDVNADQALTYVRSKRWIANPMDKGGYMDFLRNEFQPVQL